MVWRVVYSPDGRWIASGSHDRTAKVWEAATAREAATFKGHTDRVWGVAISPDSRRVLSGSDDQTARICNPAVKAVLRFRTPAHQAGHVTAGLG